MQAAACGAVREVIAANGDGFWLLSPPGASVAATEAGVSKWPYRSVRGMYCVLLQLGTIGMQLGSGVCTVYAYAVM